MPGVVNFVRPDGSAVGVDDSPESIGAAIQRGWKPESPEAAGVRETVAGTHAGRVEKYGAGGAIGALKAFSQGALRGATLGASDFIQRAGGTPAEALSTLREEHPGVSTAGMVAGALIPALFTGGGSAPESGLQAGAEIAGESALRATARTAAGYTPSGAIARLGAGIGARGAESGAVGAVGYAAADAALQGAAQSTGSYLSDVALGDKDLSAEGFLGAAGQGALIGGAVGGGLATAERGFVAARDLFPKFSGSKQAVSAAAGDVDRELSGALASSDESIQRAKDVLNMRRLQSAELDAAAQARMADKLAAQRSAAQGDLEAIRAQRAAASAPVPEIPPVPAAAPVAPSEAALPEVAGDAGLLAPPPPRPAPTAPVRMKYGIPESELPPTSALADQGDIPGFETPLPRPATPVTSAKPVGDVDAYVKAMQREPLDAADAITVDRYQGAEYIKANDYARTGSAERFTSPEEAQEVQAGFDRLVSKGALPEDTLLYRGASGKRISTTPGEVFTEPGYSSTSMREDVGKDFASRRDGGVLLEIQAPAGTPAAHIPATGGLDESEILLGRNARYKVVSSEVRDGRKVVRVQLLPEEAGLPGKGIAEAGIETAPTTVSEPTIAPPTKEIPAGHHEITLYRATDRPDIGEGAAFAADESDAEAYLDNPGYGGGQLRSHTTTVDPDTVLSFVKGRRDGVPHGLMKPRPFDDLAEVLEKDVDDLKMDYENSIERAIDSPKIRAQLRKQGYEWAVYEDTFPEQTTAWVYLGKEKRAFDPIPDADTVKSIAGSGIESAVTPSSPSPPSAPLRGGDDLESLLAQSVARGKAGEAFSDISAAGKARRAEMLATASRDANPAPSALEPIHEAMADVDPVSRQLVDAVKEHEAAAKAVERRFTIRGSDGTRQVAISDLGDETVGRIKQAFDAAAPADRQAILDAIGPHKAKALTEITEGRAKFTDWFKNRDHWYEDASYGPRPTGEMPTPDDLAEIGAPRMMGAEDAQSLMSTRDALDEIRAYERTHADLTAALGPAAPPSAQELAAKYGAALDEQARKATTRGGQLVEDGAKAGDDARLAAKEAAIADKLESLNLRSARHASRGAERSAAADVKAAQEGADSLRRAADTVALPGAEGAAVRKGGIGGMLADLGAANEALRAVGIHTPFDVDQIPVIGPIMGAYLKLRAALTVFKKAGFKVPLAGEARVAAGAARGREQVASAVDKLFAGGAKATGATARQVIAPQAWRAVDVLKRSLHDDGQRRPAASAPEMAKARAQELTAAVANPAAITAAVRKSLADVRDPDVLAAVTAVAMRRVTYLDKHSPQPPPPTVLGRSEWNPSPTETERFARRVRAAFAPESVLHDIADGTITPEGAETLREVYPRLYAEAQARMIDQAAKMQARLPHATVVKLSVLFRAALTASLEPAHLAAIQAAGQPQPAPQGPGPGGPPPGAVSPMPAGAPNVSQLFMTAADKRTGG